MRLGSPAAVPYLALGLAVVSVSSSALFIRLAQSSPLIIASYRMLFVSALLLPAALFFQRTDLQKLHARDMARLAAAGAFLAAHFGLWTASLGYTSVASSVVLVSTHPILVAIGEALVFGRSLPTPGLVGIGLTFLGAVVVGYEELKQGGANLLGCLLAIGGAIAMVGYLIIGRSLRQELGFLAYSSVVFLVSAVALIMAAGLSGTVLSEVAPRDLLIFLVLAIVPTIGGHTVFNWTLRHLPATVIATAFLGEPIGAAVLAWLLLHEVPSGLTLLGGSVILFGIHLTARYA